MLILVGADNCGKTTLAKLLTTKLLPGWSYRHFGVPPTINGVVDPYSYFGWFLMHARSDVIVDRLHPCELAYGYTYRGKSHLSEHEFRLLELAALAQKATVLWLYDEPESIVRRWHKDEQFDPSRLSKLQEEYEKVRQLSKLPWLRHKLTDLVTIKERGAEKGDRATYTPTPLLESIIEQEKDNVELCSMFPSPDVGYGSLTPDFVIVGEAPTFSKKVDLRPKGTFCFGHSSDFLWQGLSQCPWEKGYYINASAFRTPADMRNLMLDLLPNKVITLGQVAKHMASNLPYATSHLDHPQYVFRFRQGQTEEWLDTLIAEVKGAIR